MRSGKLLLAGAVLAALVTVLILVLVIRPGPASACLPAGGGHPPASVHQCDPYAKRTP